MQINQVKIIRSPNGTALLLNGNVIASTDYDESGSYGIDIFDRILHGISKLANIHPIYEEVSEVEFNSILAYT